MIEFSEWKKILFQFDTQQNQESWSDKCEDFQHDNIDDNRTITK